MLDLKIAAVALGFVVMIRAFIGIRKYRPCLWESYEAEGIPLALVKQRFQVYRVLFPVMGMVNGALIALLFLIPYRLPSKEPLWTTIVVISVVMSFVTMLFCYIISRPDCNWAFNRQNENEEKNRRLLRKISIFCLLLLACWLIIFLIRGLTGK